ncbi:MAG: hypothetical protein CVV47_02570 [Spirochaetae bacterium HGW-Spirochaetae-3]|nr:MAG: hypothetical protein CVV47_02570 [Spirochaetae bacterium HGW-Spirochaetae-3]
MASAAALIALSFAVGFFVSLASIGRADILYKFAISWELTKALLYVAQWAPAILLVASAISMESSDASDNFSGAAYKVLMPAFAMAAIVSIFYLLIVPGLEGRKNRLESQSQLFIDSIRVADTALREGRLADAQRALITGAAIDQLDERYSSLYDRVESASIRAQATAGETSEVPLARQEDAAWLAGNRFYLEAIEARKAGRIFDAHYLAKRSAAVYSKRPEVRRLVDETWRDLQRLGPSAEEKAAAAFYKRKLEGYARFQEGDYLEAYRIYSELAADNGADEDVKTYMARSAEGLSTIAFFIEEDERAFSRSDEKPFSITLKEPGGATASVSASRAASSEEAVYFRDLSLVLDGDPDIRVKAPFARLHGRTLVLKAVDRLRPDLVWEPRYTSSGGLGDDPGYAITVPFDQEDASMALRLSGAPEDIDLALLATGIDDAERLGMDGKPLRAELAGRAAYPFAVLMLVLIGAGLGIRFKPTEPVGATARYLTAPILVALAIPPLRVVAGAEVIAARAFATWIPSGFFMAAWLGFLGLCVVVSLFAAARIAGRGAR